MTPKRHHYAAHAFCSVVLFLCVLVAVASFPAGDFPRAFAEETPAPSLAPEASSSAEVSPPGQPPVSPEASASEVAPSVPEGPFSIVINDGNEVTSSRDVVVTMEAGGNVAFAEISNAEDFSDAVWTDFRPVASSGTDTWKQIALLLILVNTGFLLSGAFRSKPSQILAVVLVACALPLIAIGASAASAGTLSVPWKLSDGPGEKTVYARFYTASGKDGAPSPTVSDSILYEVVQATDTASAPLPESPTPTLTATPSQTPGPTQAPTVMPTPTRMPTPTPTLMPTPVPTPAPTPVLASTPFCVWSWDRCIPQSTPGSPSGASSPTPTPMPTNYPSMSSLPTVFTPVPWAFPTGSPVPMPSGPKHYVRYLGSPDVYETGTGLYISYAKALQLAAENPKFWSSIQNLNTPRPTVPSQVPRCAPLITTTLRLGGAPNTVAVNKLQGFLREVAGINTVMTTGVFDRMTEAGVKSFQGQHADEILQPLGLTVPTGIIGPNTLKVINRLSCQRSTGR